MHASYANEKLDQRKPIAKFFPYLVPPSDFILGGALGQAIVFTELASHGSFSTLSTTAQTTGRLRIIAWIMLPFTLAPIQFPLGNHSLALLGSELGLAIVLRVVHMIFHWVISWRRTRISSFAFIRRFGFGGCIADQITRSDTSSCGRSWRQSTVSVMLGATKGKLEGGEI
jgi:hypothetical protein